MIEKNRILARMPLVDKGYWDAAFELIDLSAGDILYSPGISFDYVYFPINCIVALRSQAGDDQFDSFALIGNEGMVGASIFLGDMSSTYLARVECGGKAFRLDIHFAIEVAAQLSQFRILILSYMQVLVQYSLQTAICESKHTIIQRFSCALLRCEDCLADAKSSLDLKFILQSIGVTVEQAAEALTQLEGWGLVRCESGSVVILNRSRLEEKSCQCYRLVKAEFDRLLPNRA